VTLGRLVVAWLVVAIWFYASLVVSFFILAAALRLAGLRSWLGNIPRSLLYWRPIEAAVLTLFASLWFDSLGPGEWWLVFLLVGILVTVPMQLNNLREPYWKVTFAATEVGELMRYLVAGALLAWCLS